MEEETAKMIEKAIELMIDQLNVTTLTWLKKDDKGFLNFVDPIDKKEISAHYGATHAAAAWVICGKKTGNQTLLNNGLALLESVLKRWEHSVTLPAYHFDFNNFALCVAYDPVKEENPELAECIKNTVLSTQDSNNPTINWYPMRWYVNMRRYQWTGEMRYKNACLKCKKAIAGATFQDGFIDDRIPKGKSFNLQYDVSTVAVMQFLRTRGEELDISKELGALLNVVAPDGDINYLGRGTNQIFAWGPWIYLLTSAGRDEATTAVEYVQKRLPSMLHNNNLMLNDWPGDEKFLWWDYHYCSVYTAHLLLWLVLSIEDENHAVVTPQFVEPSDSGLRVKRSDECMVVTFEGRSEYLAERGPAVALIWTKKYGMLVKGCFAPWQGVFGNNYTLVDNVLRNYCGLLSVRQNIDYSKNRYIHKIAPNIRTLERETVTPAFVPIEVEVAENHLYITWKYSGKDRLMMNFPMLCDAEITCEADNRSVPLFNTMKIRNQYSWVNLYQSKLIDGRSVKTSIEI